MKLPHWRTESARYTAFGALFGFLFPVVAYLTLSFVSRDIYLLFGVICTAPFFLGAFARLAGLRQDRLNKTNQGLEQLVAERTSSIQSMLDLSGQGFLSFGSDLLVKPEYSKECARIFGGPIQGMRIEQLLYRDLDAANEFARGMGLFFSGAAKPAVIFDLLDHDFEIGEKAIYAEYRMVADDRIMAMLTDVTEEVKLKARVRAEDERNERVLRAVRHKSDFGAFARAAEDLLARLDQPSSHLDVLSRDVHTFKGNAGFFGFLSTQQAAHELEDHLTECRILGVEPSFDGTADRLRGIFADEMTAVTNALGEDWISGSDAISVPQKDYHRLLGYIARRYPADGRLIRALELHRRRPIGELFVRFPQMAADIARQCGKRIAPLVVSGGEVRVVPERCRAIVSTFSHLLRNMIDHGIEAPDEREAAGKPPEGKVGIDITSKGESVVLRFSDDGRGIDFEEIERRARALSFLTGDEHPPASRLIEYLFRDGFSTAAEASLVSGRGVGLAAVLSAVRGANGKIAVATRTGRGTVFTITLPTTKTGASLSER